METTAMPFPRIRTREEIRKEIEEFLNDPERPYRGKDGKRYKGLLTPIGQKHALTRMITQATEYYEKVQEARKCPAHARYYLGDYISWGVVVNAKRDLEVLRAMRAELDAK